MSTELPPRTDVVIVGAGFAGCATARALADRGVRPLVLEREPAPGQHASGRGAGLGRQLAEDDTTTALAVRGAAALRSHPEVWSETGGILGFDDEALAATYLERARGAGIACEQVTRSFALAHWPQLAGIRIATALHVPTDGIIDVKRLLARLAGDLPIATGVIVESIVDGVVHTDRGVVAARVVVDACGAWAGASTADPPLDVFKRHLFVLEAAAPRTTPFFWHLGGDELYVRAHPDGILVSPCDHEVTEPKAHEPSADADARLRERLGIAAPSWLAEVGSSSSSSGRLRSPSMPVTIGRRWACQRAFAPDRKMRLGRDATRPWLVWAAALGGHGATASTAVGETVADAVLEALR